jgi:exonuclease VII large subunit
MLELQGTHAPPRVLSVGELNRLARLALERALPLTWIAGEISNFKRYDSGHCYFTLKDSAAQVDCVMFRRQAMLLEWQPADGMQVEVRASATLYEAARQVPAQRRSRCAGRGSARSTKRSSG